MKRYIVHILLVVGLIGGIVLPMSAQTRISGNKVKQYTVSKKKVNKMGIRSSYYDGVYHMVGAWVDGSYSAYIHSANDYKNTPGGYGLSGGLLYGYQNGKLLIQTGLGVTYQAMWGSVPDMISDSRYYFPRLRDTQGTEFNLQYDFFDRKDVSRNLYINLPIMAGGYLYKDLYMLAGLKMSLQVAGSTYMTASGSTTATYERYIGIIEEMDNHGYRKNVPLEQSESKLNLGFDLMAAVELGYEWHLTKKAVRVRSDMDRYDYRLRLAAFADFSLLNIAPGKDKPLYDIPENTRFDFATFQMNHVLMSENVSSAAVRNLFAGVRLTVFFFGYRTKDRCIMCESRGKQKYL